MRAATFVLPALIVISSALPHSPEAARAQRGPMSAFDVASVRENVSGRATASRRSLPGGRLVIENMSLEMLIAFAYEIRDRERGLAGGPANLLSRRFDINAIPPEHSPTTDRDHPMLLRALLRDRFKLRTHFEKRQLPVYALEVDREGTLGPSFRPSKHDCEAWARTAAGRLEDEPHDASGRPLCVTGAFLSAPGSVTRRHAGAISALVRWAQGHLHDRPVIDMTGLSGNFEWEVTFSPDVIPGPESTAPSIFTAFREQLGLKLEPTMAPRDVLVIDSIEMPAPN
jgi:uncharacterized protein (TIGR03435 family)